MPYINLTKHNTQQAQPNIYTACFLFLFIAGSDTVKMQTVLAKSNSFKLNANILLQLLYSNIFFAKSQILIWRNEIIICQTRKYNWHAIFFNWFINKRLTIEIKITILTQYVSTF